jgi:hypothetical protein
VYPLPGNQFHSAPVRLAETVRNRKVHVTVASHRLLSWLDSPSGPRPPHCRGFTITHRHTTLGSPPLDEGSVRRKELYLTSYNTHNGQTSMPPGEFEPAIPATELLQMCALDRVATGIGAPHIWAFLNYISLRYSRRMSGWNLKRLKQLTAHSQLRYMKCTLITELRNISPHFFVNYVHNFANQFRFQRSSPHRR